jgi:glycopeptide antibiotics resistance protein
MITTFLVEHSALVPVFALLLAVLGVGVGLLVLRSGKPWIGWSLFALSTLPVFALTLVPSGSAQDRVFCTVQFSLPSWGSVELLANLALFFPPAFFAVLATRRPWAVLVLASAGSVLVEGVQALVPGIGRACDTNDWMMNTIGALIGILLALGTLAFQHRLYRQ